MSLYCAVIYVYLRLSFFTLIRDIRSGSPAMQQSLCRVLGVLDYDAYPHGLEDAIKCLLGCVDRSVRTVRFVLSLCIFH